MHLSVATWNMNYWQGIRSSPTHVRDCWDYVGRLGIDLALVQEAVPLPHDQGLFLWRAVGGTRAWGTGIFSANDELRLEEIDSSALQADRRYEALSEGGLLEESHPGCVRAADVYLNDGRYVVTVVSIYGIHGDPGLNGVRYVPTTVHRMLSDLTPLLDRSWRRIVLGGDLNISPQIAYPDTRHHEVLLDRIKAFGLTDLLGHFNDDFVQTYRHPRSAKPWQDDWLFASKKLMPGLLSCKAVQTADAWRLSDHCPVVAEFEIPDDLLRERSERVPLSP